MTSTGPCRASTPSPRSAAAALRSTAFGGRGRPSPSTVRGACLSGLLIADGVHGALEAFAGFADNRAVQITGTPQLAASYASAAAAIVAILCGVPPERVVAVADVVWAARIRVIDVPLNSPDPFRSTAARTPPGAVSRSLQTATCRAAGRPGRRLRVWLGALETGLHS